VQTGDLLISLLEFSIGESFTWWIPKLNRTLISHWTETWGYKERSLYSSAGVLFLIPSDINTILAIEKRIVTIYNEFGIQKLGCSDRPLNVYEKPVTRYQYPYTGVANAPFHVEAKKIF